jgi:predicted nuclease of predicted toxin-antitoxin system
VKLKLDENLGRHAAILFRDAGHDVATVPDQGLSGAEDRQIIDASSSERRCLVTLDLDFGNPLMFNHSEYAGVAVLRLGL